jgi:hypothetical protein
MMARQWIVQKRRQKAPHRPAPGTRRTADELGRDEQLRGGGDRWQSYLPWGVMIPAVGLIAGLAFRLYGQSKQTGTHAASDGNQFELVCGFSMEARP